MSHVVEPRMRGVRRVALVACVVFASCTKSDLDAPAGDGAVPPPSPDAGAPADYPGLHNVVAYSAGLYSGSVPDGEMGFATLAAMGIRTIISVDGAAPDLERARERGLRYVHLPIGYNGMDRARTLEIARAIQDLEGPVYLHCHHGKHRSAGALGAAVVALGRMTSGEAVARMKVSGTSPGYTGLYRCVALAVVATAAELSTASNAFPEVWKTSGLVKTMVEIDESYEHLLLIEKAGWKPTADHPDLVPAAVAGQLADLQRHLTADPQVQAKPAEFTEWLREGSRLATVLEDGLIGGSPPQDSSATLQRIAKSCKGCHVKYRD